MPVLRTLLHPRTDVQMQCAAMAAAIKKEILEDEERQHRRSAETELLNGVEAPTNGHADIEMDSVEDKRSNGHAAGVPNKNHEDSDKEVDREEDQEDLRRQELRTHLFLATVSSHHHHQQHHHQQQQLHPQQDMTCSMSDPNTASFHVPCPLCQIPLEQRVFRQHLDRHYPRDSPVCPVIQCARRFAHPNSVRNHMRLKHAVQWLKMKAMRSSGGPFVGLPSDHPKTASTLSTSTTSNSSSSSNPFTKKEFL